MYQRSPEELDDLYKTQTAELVKLGLSKKLQVALCINNHLSKRIAIMDVKRYGKIAYIESRIGLLLTILEENKNLIMIRRIKKAWKNFGLDILCED